MSAILHTALLEGLIGRLNKITMNAYVDPTPSRPMAVIASNDQRIINEVFVYVDKCAWQVVSWHGMEKKMRSIELADPNGHDEILDVILYELLKA